MSSNPDLETVVEMDEADFKEHIGAALAPYTDEATLGELLVNDPETYDRLTQRMATLDGIADFAEANPEVIDDHVTVLWTGMGLIANTVPEVADEITTDVTVTWEALDSPAVWHAETDADAGSIEGGPGELEDAEIRFEGQTDVLFSMLGDDEFNPPLAFVQNRFDVIGSLERAREFSEMMESVTESMEELA